MGDPKLGPTRATTIPTDPKERKTYPIASGFFDYFPDAIAAVAHLSYVANEQHNPGEPLHWAREKSTDEADTLLRHFAERGTLDTDKIRHSTKVAWRALAMLQKEIEREQAAVKVTTEVFAHRAKGGEQGCFSQQTDGNRWHCERERGHTGDHMAWKTYGNGELVLREGGRWS